jgi:hypothetical protein
VQVFGPRRDPSRLVDSDLVVRIVRAGRDEPHRLAALGFQPDRESVQIVERARAEERTDAVEDRVL